MSEPSRTTVLINTSSGGIFDPALFDPVIFDVYSSGGGAITRTTRLLSLLFLTLMLGGG